MAKMAKKKQTDYTKAGKAISDTAVPLYQENLGRIGEYLDNPQARIDDYLQRYYTNTSKENDFLRNYNRAMSGMTAQNYGATHGGYSSANQMSYDDLQRSMNDEAARLRDYGITSSANLANMDYQNMLSGNGAFQNAYSLGKEYSDIDQYNYMAHQNNKFGNQLMGGMGAVGGVLQSIPNPWTQAIGGAMSLASNMGTTYVPGMGAGGAGGANQGLLSNEQTSLIGGALMDLFGKRNANKYKIDTKDAMSRIDESAFFNQSVNPKNL